MLNFRTRTLAAELLDHAAPEEAQRNLANLRRLNRWTGAGLELRRQLRQHFAPAEAFRFLDIGAASGDMSLGVGEAFANSVRVSLDLSFEHLRHAEFPKVAADAFHLPFADGSFDVVHCSLFLHHFSDVEVEALLREMYRVARRLVLAQDLHRHMLAYYFLPATAWLFGWDRLMLHDGPVSVAAGWKRAELERLLESVGLAQRARVRWHFPSFRYFIAIQKGR
jgi:SAM-dependent methyltransferase